MSNDATSRGAAPTLSLRNVSMVFPGQRALNRVNLELRAGEVHALVGQNGSGKSTLIKILAGFHTPAPGFEAHLNDREFELGSAHAAHAAGLRFIHQDLGLVGSLDCVDNLALGRGYDSRWWVSIGRERKRARAVLSRYGLDVDVQVPIEKLTSAERTMIAIARALETGAGGAGPTVLVLDEPTEALARREVSQLFDMLRAVASAGTAVLYVSHRLDEVLEIADVVTVLRDGAVMDTVSTSGLERDLLVEMIVGRRLEALAPFQPHAGGREILRACELSGASVERVGFSVHEREILGIAGLIGSGREELPGLIGGARPWTGGVLEVDGASNTSLTPRRALAQGIVFVASDRARLSSIPSQTARENVTLPRLSGRGALRWLSTRRERDEVLPWMHRTEVVPCEPERIFSTFSGGNQQKVVLARALRLRPTVLIIDEPVQGVDVGARAGIFGQLMDTAAAGVPIVVASSDAEELAKLCTRVLVLGHGRIVAELAGSSLSAEQIIDASMRTATNLVAAHA